MSLRHSLPLVLGRITAGISPKFDAAFWRYLRLPKTISIWRSTGITLSNDPGTLISAGIEPRADYFPALFFGNEFKVESLGQVSPFKLRRTIDALRSSVDLVALRMDRIQARIFDSSYIKVPEWVRSSLPVPAEIQTLAFGHNSLRQDLRLIRKHGYTVTLSHDEQDFEKFYQLMYLPHGHGRHGPHAHLRSRSILYESFHRGVLLLVKQADEAIAGLVIEKNATVINFAGIGVRGGEERLLKMGALSACYYFGLQYARQNGFSKVDLGGTRPCCTDSLLKYKRKWGAVIETAPLNTNDYIMYWRVANRAVSALIDKYPLIVRDRGQLSALAVAGSENRTFPLPSGLSRKIEITAMAPLRWPLPK